MRPLFIEIEGLTAFRERASLDMSTLDLFAITGPTGSGKTSVVDAMLWALFGQVPRVGKEYRQLLSHGSPRIAVRLDFAAGEERFRVVRSANAKGRLQVRLERIVQHDATTSSEAEPEETVEPIADRAADVAQHIERIVGLTYQAFVRAVVLPQGEFDRFLKGEPGERRAILASLLDLHVYERMAALARRQAAQARAQVDLLGTQLQRDFAAATPAELGRSHEELTAARERIHALEHERRALADLVTRERELDAARAAHAALREQIDAARAEAQEAEASLVQAAAETARLADELARVDREIGARAHDEERTIDVARLRAEVAQVVDAAEHLDRLSAEAETARERAHHAAEAARAERERRQQAEAALAAAEQRHAAAQAALDRAREHHAAHTLRHGLRPGDPCPVCERRIETLPEGDEAPDLDAAGAAVEGAARALAKSRRETDDARQRAVRAEAAETTAAQMLTEREERLSKERERLAERTERLPLQGTAGDLGANALAQLSNQLDAEWRALEAQRAKRNELLERRHTIERVSAEARHASGAAEGRGNAARSRLSDLQAQLEAAGLQVRTAETALDGAWSQSAPRPADAAARLDAIQAQLAESAACQGRLEQQIEHLERSIARAAEIEKERAAMRSTADTAHTLARALQADGFMAFIQEEALARLAADGTLRLQGLSHGRYSLHCQADEFVVVDHWNADAERSVKTLSGGETFLASLALALALADRVTELSSGANGRVVLESLFLDEGFGTLDADALDTAASALESLQDGHRMVGVITHLEALAERLPARIVVARGQIHAGSGP